MVYRESDELRTFHEKSREAVQLAIKSRWAEAAELNRELIAYAPDDADAYNRLGKALMELGDTEGARSAFEHSLTLNPTNTIAQKNLQRLAEGVAQASGASSLSHKMFISEAGKSAQVALLGCQSGAALPYVAPGTPIELRSHRGNLVAYTTEGGLLGVVPPKLGHRLVTLMDGGNQYAGAVVSVCKEEVQVLLHESFQHPSLRSKVSFPAAVTASVAAPSMPRQSMVDDDDEGIAPVAVANEDPADGLLDLADVEDIDDEFSEVDVADIVEDDDDADEDDGDQDLDEAI